jgi:hypothetical protein
MAAPHCSQASRRPVSSLPMTLVSQFLRIGHGGLSSGNPSVPGITVRSTDISRFSPSQHWLCSPFSVSGVSLNFLTVWKMLFAYESRGERPRASGMHSLDQL